MPARMPGTSLFADRASFTSLTARAKGEEGTGIEPAGTPIALVSSQQPFSHAALLTRLKIIFINASEVYRPSRAHAHAVAHEQTRQFFPVNQDNALMTCLARKLLGLIRKVARGYKNALSPAMPNESADKCLNVLNSNNKVCCIPFCLQVHGI